MGENRKKTEQQREIIQTASKYQKINQCYYIKERGKLLSINVTMYYLTLFGNYLTRSRSFLK